MIPETGLNGWVIGEIKFGTVAQVLEECYGQQNCVSFWTGNEINS